MKTYILYHKNCYDGFGAAYAAKTWEDSLPKTDIGGESEYIPVAYGEPMPTMEDHSNVFILDFSYPREQLLELKRRMIQVQVIDHHQTAQKDLEGLPFALFDMKRSGATMAWDYFHEGIPYPALFPYLQDRDLWTQKLPQTQEVASALRMYPMDFKVWESLVNNAGVEKLKIEGDVVLRFTNNIVDIMCQQARMMDVGGYMVPVANATIAFSEVGQALLKKYPNVPFTAYYLDRADGMRQWGMRSRPDFDCSEVAKKYGGGGHKNAAGFVEKIP